MKVPSYTVFYFHFFVWKQRLKEHFDENDFCHGSFFKGAILKVTCKLLISAMFRIPKNYEAHWQRYLKDTLRFYGHGSTYVLIFSWVNIMKQQ